MRLFSLSPGINRDDFGSLQIRLTSAFEQRGDIVSALLELEKQVTIGKRKHILSCVSFCLPRPRLYGPHQIITALFHILSHLLGRQSDIVPGRRRVAVTQKLLRGNQVVAALNVKNRCPRLSEAMRGLVDTNAF